MKSTDQQIDRTGLLQRWLVVIIIALISGVIGESYSSVTYNAGPEVYYQGYRTGFSIGFFASAFEVFYIRPGRRSWIRRIPFLAGLFVRILTLALIVRAGYVANELMTSWLNGRGLQIDFELNEQVRDSIFSLVLIVLFVVVSQLTSLVGLRRFSNLVIGRYYRPVTEQRIFMFVDLLGSSALARRLGNVKFHEYLSEFFRVLDPAIVQAGGEIVSYVGDAVIVTWPLSDNKKRNARCLTALRLMNRNLTKRREVFINVFGWEPEFRAALHGGEVVVGECGDSRKQITFLGDVVNITARIEDVSKQNGEPFLASDSIVQHVTPVEGVQFETIGDTEVKGIDTPILLYRIVLD